MVPKLVRALNLLGPPSQVAIGEFSLIIANPTFDRYSYSFLCDISVSKRDSHGCLPCETFKIKEFNESRSLFLVQFRYGNTDTMTRNKNRRERRHPGEERSFRSLVENGRSAILDVVPNTVLQTAVALNELIYIGCENMEFGQSQENYFDHSLLDESDTFETRTLATLSYETGTLDGSNGSTVTSWKSDGQTLTSLRNDANSMMTGVSSVTSSNSRSKKEMMLRVPIPIAPLNSPPQPGSDDDRSSHLPAQLISGDVNVSVTYVPRTQHDAQTQDQLKILLENNSIDDSSTWSAETPRIEGQEKSIEGSLRSMRLTLKKMIDEINLPSELSAQNENEKDSNHPNPSCALDQEQTTENEGHHFSRRFRRPIFNRKEQRSTTTTTTTRKTITSSSSSGTSSRDLENTDLSKKSSPFFTQRRKANEKEHDNHLINPSSLRTRSILDRNKISGVKNYSLRIMGRSVGKDSDNLAHTKELDNDFSGPFGISILKSRSKNNKKPSLISRLRGLAKEEKEALSTPSEFQKKDDDDDARLEDREQENFLLSPTHSTTLLSGPSSFSSKDEKGQEPISHVFLDPSDKGQEIAIQDDKYFYHDPAQIHSLLTLPTFDVYTANEIYNSKEL